MNTENKEGPCLYIKALSPYTSFSMKDCLTKIAFKNMCVKEKILPSLDIEVLYVFLPQFLLFSAISSPLGKPFFCFLSIAKCQYTNKGDQKQSPAITESCCIN